MGKLATKEETALTEIPDYLKEDMASDAGNENVGKDDILIPRIMQAQGLSPQLDEGDPKYIDGLKPGQLFNSVTNKIYPSPAVFVPFAFQKTYPVFTKRNSAAGGGFEGVFNSQDEAVRFIATAPNMDDLEVQPTHVHWVIVQGLGGEWSPAAIHMYSTKLTTSKNLNTLVKMRGGARWVHMYALSSKSDEIKGKGKFQRLMVTNHEGWPPAEVVALAKEYHSMVLEQSVRSEFNNDEEKPESKDF